MKKASGRLTMSMQPRRELEGKPVTKLMDVQDNTGRGDGDSEKGEYVSKFHVRESVKAST